MSEDSNRILELEDELKMALIQCESLRCISEKYREELDQLRDYSNTEITEREQVECTYTILFPLFIETVPFTCII
jgi:hypothetical protein